MKLAMLALLAVATIGANATYCEPPVGLIFARDDLINEKEAAPAPFNSYDSALIMATCAKAYAKFDFESQREICDQYARYFSYMVTTYYTERIKADDGHASAF